MARHGEGCLTENDFQVWYTAPGDDTFKMFHAFAEHKIAARVARSLVDTGLASYAEIRMIQDWFRPDSAPYSPGVNHVD